LRSDRGGEFTSTKFKEFLLKFGIRHEQTYLHTPEQNGGAELENRTIVESVRSMLHAKQLNLVYCVEAMQTAIYVLNRAGSHA
jgi:transposase InsO family protein